jgi:hypothetical protein
MSNQQKVNALLVKLEHCTAGIEINNVIKELLNLSESLDRVVNIVERRIDQGVYVLSQTLANLLAKERSKTLYAKVSTELHKDVWSLLILYKAKYPDEEIEKMLTKTFYSIAADDSNFVRSAIIEAMREVGSKEVLPTLEAIAYDLRPGTTVGKFFSNALGDPIKVLEARSRYSFFQDLLITIDEIKRRTSLSGSNGEPPLDLDTRDQRTDLYVLICEIETLLHGFVKETLLSIYGDEWWQKGIPLQIRKDCQIRKEEDSTPSNDPYQYTTLIDLKAIIEKKWAEFSVVLPKPSLPFISIRRRVAR